METPPYPGEERPDIEPSGEPGGQPVPDEDDVQDPDRQQDDAPESDD